MTRRKGHRLARKRAAHDLAKKQCRAPDYQEVLEEHDVVACVLAAVVIMLPHDEGAAWDHFASLIDGGIYERPDWRRWEPGMKLAPRKWAEVIREFTEADADPTP